MKKIRISWKRIWQRSLILMLMAALFIIILNTGVNFFLFFAWSEVMLMFIIFWLKRSNKANSRKFFQLGCYISILLALIGGASGYRYALDGSIPAGQLSVASFIAAILFIIYLTTLWDNEIRTKIKLWLGSKFGYTFLMILAHVILSIGKLNFFFDISKKSKI